MKRVYLDNCCFNRPFDDQSHVKIRLETEAKLEVQARILLHKLELAWSYILDFENMANPYNERCETIQEWRKHAKIDIDESGTVLKKAHELSTLGLKNKDSLHVACAIEAKCDFFLTTDRKIINKSYLIQEISVCTPIDLIEKDEE
ncbi:MAG: hypothetical protein ACOC08_04520 [Campylobacterales bacterium]